MIRQSYPIVLLVGVFAIVWALPQQSKSRRPVPEFKNKTGGLELPNNATLIRENIVDNFSCQDRIYGYYADMENDCQVFHVCMPQARGSTRWSFICPAETVFNQATFVCTLTENSIPCEESESFYNLNEAIGKEVEEEESDMEHATKESDAVEPISSKPPVRTSRILNRKKSLRASS
ncbi:U-scoloptoxin(01)-Er1a-like [Colletes gigas]|uniref:U-scoloptoxin(01)-Er1a-like n=1 Tax=Colletes gigas TaxID=935657 RepID=UPI001C9B8218|nr:U-scoloptoxin(01)-Er1a-like [Colletes gigas]